MQLAVIEFARRRRLTIQQHGIRFIDYNPVVALITSGTTVQAVEKRTEESDLGGTMRLGSQNSIKPGTMAARIYGTDVNERIARYEVNNASCATRAGGW